MDQISGDPNRCLPRQLATEEGRIRCLVLEAMLGACDCSRPGRGAAADNETRVVRQELAARSLCGGTATASCDDYCVCEILQPSGAATDPTSGLHACQNETVISDPELAGVCYIDARAVTADGTTAPLGNPELVSQCPEASPRRLRFVGADTPASGSLLFISCAAGTP